MRPKADISDRQAYGRVAATLDVPMQGGDKAVGEPRFCIGTDVRFHDEVPLFSFIGLVHLGVALAHLSTSGRSRQVDDSLTNILQGIRRQRMGDEHISITPDYATSLPNE